MSWDAVASPGADVAARLGGLTLLLPAQAAKNMENATAQSARRDTVAMNLTVTNPSPDGETWRTFLVLPIRPFPSRYPDKRVAAHFTDS